MNPNEDALAGLINQSERATPSVSHALVDHLREKFSHKDLMENSTVETAEDALSLVANIAGVWYIIDYLASLLPPNPLTDEENTNEPSQAESPGTDPRRPGTRTRG